MFQGPRSFSPRTNPSRPLSQTDLPSPTDTTTSTVHLPFHHSLLQSLSRYTTQDTLYRPVRILKLEIELLYTLSKISSCTVLVETENNSGQYVSKSSLRTLETLTQK